jgi:hypothetical protein
MHRSLHKLGHSCMVTGIHAMKEMDGFRTPRICVGTGTKKDEPCSELLGHSLSTQSHPVNSNRTTPIVRILDL